MGRIAELLRNLTYGLVSEEQGRLLGRLRECAMGLVVTEAMVGSVEKSKMSRPTISIFREFLRTTAWDYDNAINNCRKAGIPAWEIWAFKTF